MPVRVETMKLWASADIHSQSGMQPSAISLAFVLILSEDGP